MFELVQVAQAVVHGQTPLPRPSEGIGPPALRDEHPRPQRGDRPDVRREVTDVAALRLVEQLEGAAQVAVGLADPGHRDPPAIAVLRQADVLAQVTARLQVLPGGVHLVSLTKHVAQAHVHVRRSTEHGPVLLGAL